MAKRRRQPDRSLQNQTRCSAPTSSLLVVSSAAALLLLQLEYDGRTLLHRLLPRHHHRITIIVLLLLSRLGLYTPIIAVCQSRTRQLVFVSVFHRLKRPLRRKTFYEHIIDSRFRCILLRFMYSAHHCVHT